MNITSKNYTKALNKRNKFKNIVICVTGTKGKTTTVKIIYELLKSFYKVNKTFKNSNSLIGLPYSINKFDLNSDFWICELGISKINEMNLLLDLVKPHIRILTNIDIAHTENFNNENDYKEEKIKFVKTLKKNDIFLYNPTEINYEFNINDYIKKLNNKGYNIKIITCGVTENCDIFLKKFFINNINSYFDIIIDNKLFQFNVKGLGKHHVLDICFGLGIIYHLNKSYLFKINDTISNFKLYDDRGLFIKKKKFIIFDYSYNSSPSSIISNLNYFNEFESDNKIIILGNISGILNKEKYYLEIIEKSINISNKIVATSFDIYEILKKKVSNNNNYLISYYDIKLKNKICLIHYLFSEIKNNNNTSIFVQSSHDQKLGYISKVLKVLNN